MSEEFLHDVEALRLRVQDLEQEKKTAYQDGYIAALREYAHGRDGVQYVGFFTKTLNQAVEEFLARR